MVRSTRQAALLGLVAAASIGGVRNAKAEKVCQFTPQEGAEQAISGSEAKYTCVNGHHQFHVKPVNVVDSGEVLVATGQVSHVLGGWRRDDQVHYRIVIGGAGTPEVSYRVISRGGWCSVPFVGDTIRDSGYSCINTTWEPALAALLDVIAAKLL